MNLTGATETGVLTRLPAGAKLAVLFGVSILLFVLGSTTALALLAGLVLAVALVFCRAALVLWLRSWVLIATIALVVAWTAYAEGATAATVTALRLGTLSVLATIVTATTTIGQFMDTITRLLRPLERLGIANARDVALAIGLVIRFVPEVLARYHAVADAHRARALKPRPATIIVPLVIGTLKSADEIASAIDARGIRSQPDMHS